MRLPGKDVVLASGAQLDRPAQTGVSIASQGVVRAAAIAAALALTVSGVLDWVAGLVAVASAVALSLDNVFSVRNYFLVYALMVFGIGGRHFAPDDLTVSVDLLVYFALFVAAYSLASLVRMPAWLTQVRHSAVNDRSAATLVVALIGGWVALLATHIGIYGLAGFYGGQALADRLSRYGRGDFVTGLTSVVEQGLSILTVAAAVIYVQACTGSGKRPSYLLLSVPLIAAPLLLLRRYEFALGLLFLLMVQAVTSKLIGARYSLLASIPLIAGSLALAFAVSILVGSIRESALAAPLTPTRAPDAEGPIESLRRVDPLRAEQPLITEERTLGLIYSELSPIIAYRDIREHPADFGYQFGNTIVPPLLLKVVPRGWLPDKPISSSALYNRQRSPDAFAAGYALPITVFGDLLLNFGYLGAIMGSVMLGVLARKLDGFMTRGVGSLAVFLIIYYHFYSLLRVDLANSLALILLTACAVLALRLTLSHARLPKRMGIQVRLVGVSVGRRNDL